MYSFLNTTSIMRRSREINLDEWNFFLRGSPTDYSMKENKCSDWCDDKVWISLHGIEECHPNFSGIVKSFLDPQDQPQWKKLLKSDQPELLELPTKYEAKLSSFQRCMVIKILQQTKMMYAVKEFVKKELGPMFIESPPFDLEGTLADSKCYTPIIFILSPGADPIAYLHALAEKKGMD